METERFKNPTYEELCEFALVFITESPDFKGEYDKNELANMVAMAKLICDRLYYNGTIYQPSKKENEINSEE